MRGIIQVAVLDIYHNVMDVQRPNDPSIPYRPPEQVFEACCDKAQQVCSKEGADLTFRAKIASEIMTELGSVDHDSLVFVKAEKLLDDVHAQYNEHRYEKAAANPFKQLAAA